MKNLVLALTVLMAVPAFAQSSDVGTPSPSRQCISRLSKLSRAAQLVGRTEKNISRSNYTDSSLRAANQKYIGRMNAELQKDKLELRNLCIAGNAQTCADSLDAFVAQNRHLGRLIQIGASYQLRVNTGQSIVRNREIVTGCMILEESASTSSGSNPAGEVETGSTGTPARAN